MYAPLIIHCRYLTELIRGETLCLMLCALLSVAWLGGFKTSFKWDLAERQANISGWLKMASALDPCFKDLKYLPKGEREELWNSLLRPCWNKKPAELFQTPQRNQQRRRRGPSGCWLQTQNQNQTTTWALTVLWDSEISMKECPLQWWSTLAGAHPQLSALAHKYLATPATSVSCKILFILAGNSSEEEGSPEIWECEQASLCQRLAERKLRCIVRPADVLLLSCTTCW